MVKNQAQVHLEKRLTEVRVLMAHIDQELGRYQDIENTTDYGYAGDLAYVSEELENVRQFLHQPAAEEVGL